METENVSNRLIEAYEEVRRTMLNAEKRTASFFPRVLSLLQDGGMAEFIASSSEVFSAQSHEETAYLPVSRSESTMKADVQFALKHLLVDIALTNVCEELRV